MSYQNQGQSSGDEFKPSGNRPAQNARQSTPSAMSQSHFTGDGEAADFLGLGEEVGGLGASEMMAPTQAPAPVPEVEGYDEDDEAYEAYEDTVDTLDESEDDFDDDFDDEDDDGVHSSWVDDAPPTGRSVLPKLGVAVVLGMAATAGFFAMQQNDGGEVAGVTPLAPEMNTTPTYQERMFDRSEEPAPRVEVASIEVDAPTAEGSEPEPPASTGPVASQGGTPASSLVAAAGSTPVPELSGVETTAGEDEVRDATETVAGLVPAWRAGQTPPPGGGFEHAEEEQGSTVLVVGDETGAPGVGDHEYWDEIDETVAEEVGSGGRGKFLGWDEPLTGALTAAPTGAGAEPLGFDGETDAQAAGEPLDQPLDQVVERLSGWEDDEVSDADADDDGADDGVTEELATGELVADDEEGETTEPAPVAGLDAGTETASDPVAAEVSESWTEPVARTPVQPLEVSGERVVTLVTEQPELAAEDPAPQGTETAQTETAPTETVQPEAGWQVEDPVAAAETPVASGASGPGTASTDEPTAGGTAFGPSLPAGVELAPVASAPETNSTTRVRVMQTADVLEQGSRGPRPATAEEMKGVWLQPEVPPMHAIVQKHKVLTPQVGQVRVILKDGEIFQGRLYAMGEGRVWLNSDRFGQTGLDGVKVDRIQRILAGDKSTESTAGVDSLDEMESVRIKTPGGILVGKVINRDVYQTTIVTDDGARVTLATKQVEILDQAPGVTLKRATPAPSSGDGDREQP